MLYSQNISVVFLNDLSIFHYPRNSLIYLTSEIANRNTLTRRCRSSSTSFSIPLAWKNITQFSNMNATGEKNHLGTKVLKIKIKNHLGTNRTNKSWCFPRLLES